MRTNRIPLLLAAAASLALGACNSSKSDVGSSKRALDFQTYQYPTDVLSAQEIAARAPSCGKGSTCHYPSTSPTRLSPAPNSGVHTAHLGDVPGEVSPPGASTPPTPLMAKLACGSCHFVPDPLNISSVPEHRDGIWTVRFQLFAVPPTASGLTPVWNGTPYVSDTGLASKGCANVYCHGATLHDGLAGQPQKRTEWIWNSSAAAVRCSDCHGAPPNTASHQGMNQLPAGQPATQCASCHGSTVNAQGAIIAAGHINGTVEATGCTTCHGFPPNLAAGTKVPLDPNHPNNTSCSTCHPVPPSSTVHDNGTVDFVGGSGSCNICHGFPPPPGTNNKQMEVGPSPGQHPASSNCGACHPTPGAAPSHQNNTVNVEFTSASCDLCHGNPPTVLTHGTNPTAPHPASTATGCNDCHATTVTAAGAIVTGGTHRNGTWGDISLTAASCDGCHGFPPVSLNDKGVTRDHPALATGESCLTCHGTGLNGSTVVADANHRNGQPNFIATAQSCRSCHGAPPTTGGHPAATLATCTACHPSPTSGAGTTASPYVLAASHDDKTINVTIVAPGSCSLCHGAPPQLMTPPNLPNGQALAHPASTLANCTTCHAATVNAAGQVTEPPHRNGTVDAAIPSGVCSDCHGFPPASHVAGNYGTACSGCHPATVQADNRTLVPNSTTHMNGVADIAGGGACNTCHGFPPGPTTNPPSPLHAAGNDIKACSSCHPTTINSSGSFVAGGTHSNGSVNATCSICHGIPPPAKHVPSASLPNVTFTNCATCHATSVKSATEIVFGGPHMDGNIDVTTCTACHGFPPATATHPATGTTVACNACHPTSVNADNSIPSDSSGRAVGTHWDGKVDVLVSTTLHCDWCHGAPPPAPHPAVSSATTGCRQCHAKTIAADGTVIPAANGGQHLDKTVDIALVPGAPLPACNGCHLTGLPPDSGADNHHSGKSCSDCHSGYSISGSSSSGGSWGRSWGGSGSSSGTVTSGTVNATLHMNGTKNVGGTNTRIKTWDPVRRTCTSSCHGSSRSWGGTYSTALEMPSSSSGSCKACHGLAPNTGKHSYHASRVECAKCHPGYTTADANPTLHLNGKEDVGGTGTSIKSWNASTRSCSTSCHSSSRTWDSGAQPIVLTCTGCHAFPPPAPHPADTACSKCHTKTVTSTLQFVPGPNGTANTTHQNGQVDF